MDIADLVEKAIEESRNDTDEEEYDDIEIIDEDDYGMDAIGDDGLDAELAEWQDEVCDEDDIEEEDDLAA